MHGINGIYNGIIVTPELAAVAAVILAVHLIVILSVILGLNNTIMRVDRYS